MTWATTGGSLQSPCPTLISAKHGLILTSLHTPTGCAVLLPSKCSPRASISCRNTLPQRCPSSSSSSAPSSSSIEYTAGACPPQSTINAGAYSYRRSGTVSVSATADSDRALPSKDEDDGGKVIDSPGDSGQVTPTKPSPEIEPEDVVSAQLKALHDGDLLTVFEFASPKNKAHTGPFARFSEMIKGRAYNVMFRHESAEILSTLHVTPGRFQQRVLIKGSDGKQACFLWCLSKQEADPHQGCWMTDSVHRDEVFEE